MKINYKNTALNLLEKWDEEINVPDPHRPMTEEQKRGFGTSLLQQLEKSSHLFGEKVQYISHPFMEAYNKGKHKLVDVFDKEEVNESGTFIWQHGSFTHTTFYALKTWIDKGEWKADYIFIQFSKHAKNDFKSVDVSITGLGDEEKTFLWKGHHDEGCTHGHYFSFLVSFLCFIKHVELETKVIQPQKKEFHIGTKYVNETKKKIEVLDSTWFTTIVRSEGFDVRGHFRFQVMGKGRSDRKLIWIPGFEKTGYTRKAKLAVLQS